MNTLWPHCWHVGVCDYLPPVGILSFPQTYKAPWGLQIKGNQHIAHWISTLFSQISVFFWWNPLFHCFLQWYSVSYHILTLSFPFLCNKLQCMQQGWAFPSASFSPMVRHFIHAAVGWIVLFPKGMLKS